MLRDASIVVPDNVPANQQAHWMAHRFWANPGDKPETPRPSAKGADVAAYVSEGRWVVQCPDCSSAQLASRTDHRFLCHECGNFQIEGRFRRVEWPVGVAAIEAALEQRPNVATRNWLPGESLEQLETEARAHGIGAPLLRRTASDFEGHTHTWPRRPDSEGFLTCKVCGLATTPSVMKGEI